MTDIVMLIEQFGAWAFVAVFAGFLLKYMLNDLRKDNERNYAMGAKLHDRMDEVVDSLKYCGGFDSKYLHILSRNLILSIFSYIFN